MAGLVDNQTSCGVQLSITECSRDQPSTIEDVVLALCDIYIVRWFSLRSSCIAQYTMHMHNSHANLHGEKSVHRIAQCLSLYCARCSHQYRRVAHSSTHRAQSLDPIQTLVLLPYVHALKHYRLIQSHYG